METALKLLTELSKAVLSIAEDYNKRARFGLSEGDMKEAERYKRWADDQLEKAKEYEYAIEEIQKALAQKALLS